MNMSYKYLTDKRLQLLFLYAFKYNPADFLFPNHTEVTNIQVAKTNLRSQVIKRNVNSPKMFY